MDHITLFNKKYLITKTKSRKRLAGEILNWDPADLKQRFPPRGHSLARSSLFKMGHTSPEPTEQLS